MHDFPFAIVGFDLDGTLLDTHRDLAAAVNHALAVEGRKALPIGEIRDLIGGGPAQMLGRALALTGGGVSPERFEVLKVALVEFYSDHIADHSSLFAGGEAMLTRLLERGVKLAVVTNKFEALGVKLIGALGLARYFYTIIGGDTLGPGRSKPAPDLLFEMSRRGGGGRAAYIGDTSYDTRASQAAAMPCVVVSFGFNDAPPETLGADAVIGHYDELIPALERL